MEMPGFGNPIAAGHSPRNQQQSLIDRGGVNFSDCDPRTAPEGAFMRSGESGTPDQHGGSLLDLLLTEVIPRLNQRCGPRAEPSTGQSATPGRPVALMRLDGRQPTPGPLFIHALELAECCQRGNANAASTLIAQLRASGTPLEALFLQIIQPAAQHLGQGWTDDRISFTDVTIALGLLQQLFSGLMDDFIAEYERGPQREADSPSAFFCTLPGTQHRLGVQMVRAFFARAGWNTRLGQGDEPRLFSGMAAMTPDLIAVSLGSETDIRNAAAFILRARNVCRHFKPTIMVGGAAVPFFPSLVDRLDADIVSGDAVDALARATELVKERSVGAC